MIAFFRYFTKQRQFSSVGQSVVLITRRSRVRSPYGPKIVLTNFLILGCSTILLFLLIKIFVQSEETHFFQYQKIIGWIFKNQCHISYILVILYFSINPHYFIIIAICYLGIFLQYRNMANSKIKFQFFTKMTSNRNRIRAGPQK